MFYMETNDFRKELASVINKYSKENGSNTPDFILAEYLEDCLSAFDKATMRSLTWRNPSILLHKNMPVVPNIYE